MHSSREIPSFLQLLPGFTFLASAIAGLGTGKILARSSIVHRAEKPATFWFLVFFHFAFGIVLISMYLTSY